MAVNKRLMQMAPSGLGFQSPTIPSVISAPVNIGVILFAKVLALFESAHTCTKFDLKDR